MNTAQPAVYRKRPVETRAVQLRWAKWSEVCDLLGDALHEVNPGGARTIPAAEASDTCGESGPDYIALDVRTVHGEIAIVRHGDWIIPDAKPGTFYPCKPAIFNAIYEQVDPTSADGGKPAAARLQVLHLPSHVVGEFVTPKFALILDRAPDDLPPDEDGRLDAFSKSIGGEAAFITSLTVDVGPDADGDDVVVEWDHREMAKDIADMLRQRLEAARGTDAAGLV